MPSSGYSKVQCLPACTDDWPDIQRLRMAYAQRFNEKPGVRNDDTRWIVGILDEKVRACASYVEDTQGRVYFDFYRDEGQAGLRAFAALCAMIRVDADLRGILLCCVSDPRNAPMVAMLLRRGFYLVKTIGEGTNLTALYFLRLPAQAVA